MKISNNNSAFNATNLNKCNSAEKNQPSFGALKTDAVDMFMKKAAASLDKNGRMSVASTIQKFGADMIDSFINIGVGQQKIAKQSPFGKLAVKNTFNGPDNVVLTNTINKSTISPFGEILGFEQEDGTVFIKTSKNPSGVSSNANASYKISFQNFIKQLADLVDSEEKKTAGKVASTPKYANMNTPDSYLEAVTSQVIEEIKSKTK